MAKKEVKIDKKMENLNVPLDEQPYEIPKNWAWTYIKYCFDVTSSKRVHQKDWLNEGVPFYRTRELVKLSRSGYVENELFISEEQYEQFENEYGVPSINDILISGVGTIGVPYAISNNNKFYFKDGNVIWFKNKGLFNAKYIVYLYKSIFMYNQIHEASAGTTVDTYTIINAKNTKIPLPPIVEQQRIVDYIEILFRKLDMAKEIIKNVLDSFESRKAAILYQAFSGALTKQWREENNINNESWIEVKLSEIMKSVKGKFDPNNDLSIHAYIGLEHIEKGKGIIGKASSDDINSLKSIFKFGDILYGKLRPYLNKHDIASFDGICSTDILVYRANSEITAMYVNYLMDTTEFIEYAVYNSNGINLPRVSEKTIGEYLIKLPSIQEQKEIVNILNGILKKEERAREQAEIIDSIEMIKKSILAKAFRGELGTNNETEESAIRLLEEIIQSQEAK